MLCWVELKFWGYDTTFKGFCPGDSVRGFCPVTTACLHYTNTLSMSQMLSHSIQPLLNKRRLLEPLLENVNAVTLTSFFISVLAVPLDIFKLYLHYYANYYQNYKYYNNYE